MIVKTLSSYNVKRLCSFFKIISKIIKTNVKNKQNYFVQNYSDKP